MKTIELEIGMLFFFVKEFFLKRGNSLFFMEILVAHENFTIENILLI